jgi:hypothetical protein
MIELEKISVNQYLELEDRTEYDFAIKYASIFTNQKDEYGIGDVMELPFGFIKDFQYELQSGISFEKLFSFIQELVKKKIGSEPLDKFVRFSNYLTESVRQIVEVEEKTLAYEPTDKENIAGINRFEGLGVYLQIRSLTGGDLTKYEHIRSMPYSVCFTEMYAAKQITEYERELMKLNREHDG